jgi:hypothetical protein
MPSPLAEMMNTPASGKRQAFCPGCGERYTLGQDGCPHCDNHRLAGRLEKAMSEFEEMANSDGRRQP